MPMPIEIPGLAIGPFIGLIIHFFSTVQYGVIYSYDRQIPALRNTFFLCLLVSVLFLGTTIYTAQPTEAAVLWGSRIALLALAWMPLGLILFAADLRQRRAGWIVWLATAWAGAISLALMTIHYPFVVGGPITYTPQIGLYNPAPSSFHLIVEGVCITTAFILAVKMWRVDRSDNSQLGYRRPFSVGLIL